MQNFRASTFPVGIRNLLYFRALLPPVGGTRRGKLQAFREAENLANSPSSAKLLHLFVDFARFPTLAGCGGFREQR